MHSNILTITTLALALAATSVFAQDPEVTNVEARQLDFPSLMVEVTYDVEAETETVWITLRISDDDGETWDVPVRTVEGDIGEGVEVGEGKRILWDAGEDFPDQDIEEMVVRVIADDLTDEPEAGTERTFELIEDVEIEMVWIPRGSFMMGAQDGERGEEDNEHPRHRVTFDYGFWMGKYEVTQSQWEEIMGNNPAEDRFGVGNDHPVYYVSWNYIQSFEERLEEGFRLPSESEWEYACRAGTETPYYWGDADINDYAWNWDNSNDQAHEVGQKRPNAWGLYDMSGNIYEWCEDVWHDDYDGAPEDGSAWMDGGEQDIRVLRGGSWHEGGRRSAYRYWDYPRVRVQNFGFRLVLDLRDREE